MPRTKRSSRRWWRATSRIVGLQSLSPAADRIVEQMQELWPQEYLEVLGAAITLGVHSAPIINGEKQLEA